MEEVMLALMEKTLVTYVQHALATCLFATCTFGLWMFIRVHDMFAFVINFLSNDQEPKHARVSLFKTTKTSGATMVVNLRALLDKFSHTHTHTHIHKKKRKENNIKYEGSKLQSCAIAFNLVVSCKSLGTLEPFHDSCFGHVLSKVCQYVTTKEKVSQGLTCASIKGVQINIQKCIIWLNISGKVKLAQEQACLNARLRPRKLNTLVKTRYVICFSIFLFLILILKKNSLANLVIMFCKSCVFWEILFLFSKSSFLKESLGCT